MYKMALSTTWRFFGAKAVKKDTVPVLPPFVAACSDWPKERLSSCCGSVNKKLDNIKSPTNLPGVKYVWSTLHQETISNAVVLRSTAVYDHLEKQLSSPLYQIGNGNNSKELLNKM